MDILYYKEDSYHVIEMNQDNIFLKYNFELDNLIVNGVEEMSEEQIKNIKEVIYTHKEFANLAPYEKKDIYKQLNSLGCKPIWFKNEDIQDWMIIGKEEKKDVR